MNWLVRGFRSLNLNPRVRRDPGIVTMPAAMLAELWESNEPDDAPGLRAAVEESIQRGLADAAAGRIVRRDDLIGDDGGDDRMAAAWSDGFADGYAQATFDDRGFPDDEDAHTFPRRNPFVSEPADE